MIAVTIYTEKDGVPLSKSYPDHERRSARRAAALIVQGWRFDGEKVTMCERGRVWDIGIATLVLEQF